MAKDRYVLCSLESWAVWVVFDTQTSYVRQARMIRVESQKKGFIQLPNF